MRRLTSAILSLGLLVSVASGLQVRDTAAAPADVSQGADCWLSYGGDSEVDLDAQQVRTQSANDNRTSVCNFDDYIVGDGGAGNVDFGNCFFHYSAAGEAVLVCHSKSS